MPQLPDSASLLMKAAWLASEAKKSAGTTTEMHCKPGGRIVVGCRVEGEMTRYFEIAVEPDGSLSLSWMQELRIVKVTQLQAPWP